MSVKTENFKLNINDTIKDEKRDMIITDRKIMNGRNYYKFKCNKCSYDCGKHYHNNELIVEYWILEYNLLSRNAKCPCCNNQITVEGINDVTTTDSWMIPYFQGGYDEAKSYTSGSHRKIKPICPTCGDVKDKLTMVYDIHRLKKVSCFCRDGKSYPEKFMYSVLKQLKINFVNDASVDWLYFKRYNSDEIMNGRYDFILNDYKLILEMDGNFHNKDNPMSLMTLEEANYIDKTKDELAIKNGYEIIRIDSRISDFEYIKNNILNSKFSFIFDILQVDWNKCEEFALRNIIKDICDYKNKNPFSSTSDIASVFGIVNSTVRAYLHKGEKLGWCEYNTKEAKRNRI